MWNKDVWARLTTARMVDPTRIDDLRDLWRTNAMRPTNRLPGRLAGHHLESVSRPGEIRAISYWESQEAAEDYAQSAQWQAVLRSIEGWYKEPPVSEVYYIRHDPPAR